jgi:hypothetical protein
MDKKYFLTGGTENPDNKTLSSGKNTVDLKRTQIELLKINNKLKKINTHDKESILKGYQEVFNAIQPISDYLEKMKKESMPDKENSLFNTSDKMIKLINKDDFDNYEFKYKKLQKVVPLLKLNEIKLRDIDIDNSLPDKTYRGIKDNKKTLSIDLKPVNIPTYVNVIKTEHPTVSFDDKYEIPSFQSIKKKPITPTFFNPIKMTLHNFEKEYESEFAALNTYINTAPDLKVSVGDSYVNDPDKEEKINKLIAELEERIIEIKEFITLLELPLDIIKIKEAVQSLKIIKKEAIDIEFEKNYPQTKLDLEPIELKLIENENIFSSQKIDLFGEETELDSNPYKLTGGDLIKYIEKVKDNISKDNIEKPFKKPDTILIYKRNKTEFIEIVNKFNVLYIQYKYYELFLTSYLNSINENAYQIKVFFSLREIYSSYQIFTEKFLIITNPKEYIFNASVEEPLRNQRKKMFFKHFYQKVIIYHIFTYL